MDAVVTTPSSKKSDNGRTTVEISMGVILGVSCVFFFSDCTIHLINTCFYCLLLQIAGGMLAMIILIVVVIKKKNAAAIRLEDQGERANLKVTPIGPLGPVDSNQIRQWETNPNPNNSVNANQI